MLWPCKTNLLIYNDHLPKCGNLPEVLMVAPPLVWRHFHFDSANLRDAFKPNSHFPFTETSLTAFQRKINQINLRSWHVIWKHTLNKVLIGHKDTLTVSQGYVTHTSTSTLFLKVILSPEERHSELVVRKTANELTLHALLFQEINN